MRMEDGMRFDHCIGLQDRDGLDGTVFDADSLTYHDKPLRSGENIRVGGRAYRYDGDDNLGNSIFTALEAFPKFETIEEPHKIDLFVVLEIYPMRNGHFYIWPYVQTARPHRTITHDKPSVSEANLKPARPQLRQALKLGREKSTVFATERGIDIERQL